MANFPYRQVHLDFHTSEKIEGIGSAFSPEQFENALKVGHVNSITLFAKCHHGWLYYPSKVGKIHPHLSFDLLSAQLDLCEKMGVRTEIYLSAGLDEKYIVEHSECLRTEKSGDNWDLTRPGFHRICFNNKKYLAQLCKEVDEVMRLYGKRTSGIFMDIVGIGECYCQECVRGMIKDGLDLNNPENAKTYARKVYLNYIKAIRKVVDKYDKNMPIIHNDGGAIFQGREIAFCNRGHFELESLPTGGWGYDHFPRAASYARTLGRNFLGMTGKFHRSWGEFGGYKHPNALRYETALSVACGARCSIGDQLHPNGFFDEATYKLIGSAYKEIEEKEEWLGGESVVDVAILSAEALKCGEGNWVLQDTGANRIMLEGHYLYNIIDQEEDFSKYKLLILPDGITLKGALKNKIKAYVKNGGKLLLSGKSGLDENGKFAIDFGVEFVGKSAYCPSYLRPTFDLEPNGIANYIGYSTAYDINVKCEKAEVVAKRVDTYFNRSVEHFCSHRHTPYDMNKQADCAVITPSVAYIGYDIFTEFAQHGAVHLRNFVCYVIDKMLDKTLITDFASCGITSLFEQAEENRIVQHLVYGIAKTRGDNVQVIEDLPFTGDVKCVLKTDKAVKNVYLAPTKTPIPFVCENGQARYTVPSFSCSQLVVIEY